MCRRKKTQYEQEHETRIIQLAENGPKNFWKIFKSKRSQKAICEACPVILQNHFTDLSKEEVTFLPSDIPKDPDNLQTCADYNRTLDNPITLNEICLSIKNIHPRKSAGIDNISAKALRMSMPLTYQIIFCLFNSAFHNAECPQLWKTAKLIPIYDGKVSKFDPNSYRGKAVHRAIYKAYSGLIHERLKVWSDNYGILPATHHAFGSGFSTFTPIQTSYDIIKEAIVFKPNFVCFVDFEKAFDSINRTSLLSKLRTLGVSNHFIKVIFSMIDRNRISLSTGKYLQEPTTQTVGLAQGDKLSPLLIAIFIADLSDSLLSTPNQPMILFFSMLMTLQLVPQTYRLYKNTSIPYINIAR